MGLRAIWKGIINLGEHEVPVKLYSAVRPQAGVSFDLLHESDMTPLRQVMVNESSEEPVPKEHITRGFEYKRNRHVQVDEEILEKLQPEPSRDVKMLRFIEPGELDPRYFQRSYYLGPDASAAAYAALHSALDKSGWIGLCRWVMRNIAYRGALQALDGGLLILSTLLQPEQLLSAPAKLGEQDVSAKELKTAQYLVEALAGKWEPKQYEDEYQRELKELIAAKAKGKKIEAPRREARATKSGELLELLEASVKSAKGKPAAKKTAAKSAAKTARRRGA